MMDTVTITQRHLPPELRGLPCIRANVIAACRIETC